MTAASIVASRKGLENTTLEKISETAGVSPGSVYQYFSNKKSILEGAVVQELDHNRIATLAKIKEWGNLPLDDFIRNVVSFVAQYFQSRLESDRHIFARSAELGKIEEHMAMRREVTSAVCEVFKLHKQVLQFEDLNKAATIVVHSVTGVLFAPMVDKKLEYSIEELKEDLIKLIQRFLLPDASPPDNRPKNRESV